MPSLPEPGKTPTAGSWRHWRPPTGVAGAVFWLALWFGLLWLLRHASVVNSPVLGWMQVLVGFALIGLAVPLAWRIINRHLLWSLRNKLILTYLLIGLAPVVLFVTLVLISAYIAAGQFSIHLADNRMHQQLDEMGTDNSARASRLAHMVRDRVQGSAARSGPGQPGPGRRPPPGREGPRSGPPESTPGGQLAADAATLAAQASAAAATVGEVAPNPLLARLHRHNAVYLNGVPLFGPQAAASAQSGSAAQTISEPITSQTGVPLGLPSWAADLHGNQFRGLVLDGQDLYLVAIDQRRTGEGMLTVITSLPVNQALMDVVAQNLGRVGLSGLMTDTANPTPRNGSRSLVSDLRRTSVYGGAEPSAANFCDLGVSFLSTMDITDWDTGRYDDVPIRVRSRPSLLYRQLFGSSLGGIVTNTYRYGLVALCILFGLIESVALWMALRLSGTITTSVEELYFATQRVDRGDFVGRIPAIHSGQQDQLGELSRSFNRMTGSLERLLVEQQEKERLQSELSIAQEVQANLFPRNVRDLPTLELHGICRPARSVSGDYYDFLVFHNPNQPDGSAGVESGLGIALGDISGKGISAALLMATLHSAVRAYQLAGEDLSFTASMAAALQGNGQPRVDGKLFESPGRILWLLNRHLYRSTQPSKYATLFLGHYNVETAELTYSNAGHLPPLLLGLDGKVRRLDCGGTVVGLMDNMRYEEGRVSMHSGDVLVAYSDGITEPENDFGEFGEERLMEVVSRYRDQPLDVISAQVMLALDAWIGAEEQPDDITLVLARQL
jgi:sigma-B regulation protein RsbU (phosphoserine phosphatase)